MKDIINELEKSVSQPNVEFYQADEKASMRNLLGNPNLFFLCPIKDYCITSKNADDIYIDTGIDIQSATAVELSVIVLRDAYDGEMIVKQTELIIDSTYRGRIKFLASTLFSSRDLQESPSGTQFLYTGIPFAFLKVTPIQQVKVVGIKNE